MTIKRFHPLTLFTKALAPILALLVFIEPTLSQTPRQSPTPVATLPSETPAKFEATNDGFDYVRRDVMIPMRDHVLEHPDYDAFWSDQAVDKILAAQPLKVPVMLVHSLWDQEDIYGAPAVYKAIEPKDTSNDMVFLVMGPWHHGQMIGDGNSLGALKFNSDTALTFRREILAPFLAQYLKDGSAKADIAPVTTFETGTNTWRRLSAWPAGCAIGCTIKSTPVYLNAGLKVSFDSPESADARFEEYFSDPAKPVPFRARPIQPAGGPSWARWLVDDQREASGRPDVVAFELNSA